MESIQEQVVPQCPYGGSKDIQRVAVPYDLYVIYALCFMKSMYLYVRFRYEAFKTVWNPVTLDRIPIARSLR